MSDTSTPDRSESGIISQLFTLFGESNTVHAATWELFGKIETENALSSERMAQLFFYHLQQEELLHRMRTLELSYITPLPRSP